MCKQSLKRVYKVQALAVNCVCRLSGQLQLRFENHAEFRILPWGNCKVRKDHIWRKWDVCMATNLAK